MYAIHDVVIGEYMTKEGIKVFYSFTSLYLCPAYCCVRVSNLAFTFILYISIQFRSHHLN